MKILLRSGVVISLLALLALPVAVIAEEAQDFAKDAANAESTPPMIPHLFKDTSDGKYCLGCHETGANNAPVTPHPERLSCTGCHGQGEIKAANPVKNGSN
jgi:cytochrome c-type protein NapB